MHRIVARSATKQTRHRSCGAALIEVAYLIPYYPPPPNLTVT